MLLKKLNYDTAPTPATAAELMDKKQHTKVLLQNDASQITVTTDHARSLQP